MAVTAAAHEGGGTEFKDLYFVLEPVEDDKISDEERDALICGPEFGEVEQQFEVAVVSKEFYSKHDHFDERKDYEIPGLHLVCEATYFTDKVMTYKETREYLLGLGLEEIQGWTKY